MRSIIHQELACNTWRLQWVTLCVTMTCIERNRVPCLQAMAQQAKEDLSQAVAAVQAKEHALQQQQVDARVEKYKKEAEAQHSAELSALKAQQALQLGTAQTEHAAQLRIVEAGLQQQRQSWEQVPRTTSCACLEQLACSSACPLLKCTSAPCCIAHCQDPNSV